MDNIKLWLIYIALLICILPMFLVKSNEPKYPYILAIVSVVISPLLNKKIEIDKQNHRILKEKEVETLQKLFEHLLHANNSKKCNMLFNAPSFNTKKDLENFLEKNNCSEGAKQKIINEWESNNNEALFKFMEKLQIKAFEEAYWGAQNYYSCSRIYLSEELFKKIDEFLGILKSLWISFEFSSPCKDIPDKFDKTDKLIKEIENSFRKLLVV